MPSRTALTWAGTTGAVIAAAGAGALYFVSPGLLLPPSPSAPVAAVEPATQKPAPAPEAPHAADAASSPQQAAAKASTAQASVTAPAQQSAAEPASAAQPPVAAPVPEKPAFDVVSVEPGGETVVAGRAEPNVKVALLDEGKRVAEATSDAAGQFVMIPDALPPGDHSLSLSEGAGAAALTSRPVPVSVAAPPPVVASVPAQAPTQAPPLPSPSAASAAPAPGAASVVIRSIEATGDGGMVAHGIAEPNAAVRLYVSGAFVGDARTKDDGQWSLSIEHGLTPGDYAVRADAIAAGDGKVVARAEAPFSVPALPADAKPEVIVAAAPLPPTSSSDVVVETVQTHHVERGHTLWGISQKFYGDGSRYAVIFSANAGQIRNPNLIYPGQVFVVPKGEPKP